MDTMTRDALSGLYKVSRVALQNYLVAADQYRLGAIDGLEFLAARDTKQDACERYDCAELRYISECCAARSDWAGNPGRVQA